MKSLLFVVILTVLFSCEKEDRLFEPISKGSITESLQPGNDVDYFEIRRYHCWDTASYSIFYSEGSLPVFDTIYQINQGEHFITGDICQFYNILFSTGDDYQFLTTYESIVNFLGPIDSKSEALFIAHLNGYFFVYNDVSFGIVDLGDKIRLHACKLVSTCSPVQSDRFLLDIDQSGNIKILRQTMLVRTEGCI